MYVYIIYIMMYICTFNLGRSMFRETSIASKKQMNTREESSKHGCGPARNGGLIFVRCATINNGSLCQRNSSLIKIIAMILHDYP